MSTMREGRGDINAVVVVFEQPAAVVRGLLPQDLYLSESAQTHLLYLIFSRNFFGTWFGKLHYDEFILGVPNVQLNQDDEALTYNYMPKLYLNSKLPRILGNRIHGFEKEGAIIQNNLLRLETGTSAREHSFFLGHRKHGRKLLSAEFSPSENPAGLLSSQFRQSLLQLFGNPTVSQSARRWSARHAQKMGAPFFFSTIQYDLNNAIFRPLRGRLEFGPEFVPLALSGLHVDIEDPGESNTWAIHIQTTQNVSLPARNPPLA